MRAVESMPCNAKWRGCVCESVAARREWPRCNTRFMVYDRVKEP